jgi:hypothetical protein
MAFIDFTDAAHATQIRHVAHQVLAQALSDDTALNSLEQRIVELARDEGLDTLRPVRKRSWLARFVFGPTPPSKMLANEQLEALRRLAVQTWHHGYTLPVSALREAREAGHSEIKIGAVIDTIGRSREPFRRVAA